MRRGILAASLILVLASGLGVLAVIGRPGVVRRPDPAGRPVLLVPDFANRTGRSDLVPFARELGEAVRERLDGDRGGIFAVSPRRVRPVLGPMEREVGILRIASRLGADYVLVGSLEPGSGEPLGPGSSWARPPDAGTGGRGIRLDVLLVRDSSPPHVFAERFPLGDPPADAAARADLARRVADRIALALRRP